MKLFLANLINSRFISTRFLFVCSSCSQSFKVKALIPEPALAFSPGAGGVRD